MLKPAGDGQVIAQLTELLAVEGGLVPRSSDLYRQEAMEAKALLADVQNELRKLEEENTALRKQHQEASRLAGQDAVAMERDRDQLDQLAKELDEVRRQYSELRAVARNPAALRCVQCGGRCEEERRVYAHPTCYVCLPPPPALPIVPVRGAVPSEPPAAETAQKIEDAQRGKLDANLARHWDAVEDAKRPALPGLDKASPDVQRVIARMLSAAMDLIRAEAKVREVEALLNPPAKDDE
jgi:hypothetical protein